MLTLTMVTRDVLAVLAEDGDGIAGAVAECGDVVEDGDQSPGGGAVGPAEFILALVDPTGRV